jgi:ribosomal protein S18 acetylase RimI-like enzyme
MIFSTGAANLDPEQLTGFFVGWPNPPGPAGLLRILRAADRVVLALEADRVIGFCTCITDEIYTAYIPLLEVLPEHQGRGIGSELVKRMIAGLKRCYMIDVCCDPGVVPFYEKLGLTPMAGAVRRNYDRQSLPD